MFDFAIPNFNSLHLFLNIGADYAKGAGTVIIDSNAAAAFINPGLGKSKGGGVNNQYENTRTNQLIDAYFNYKGELRNLLSEFDFTGGYSFQKWSNSSPNFPNLNQRGDTTAKPAPFPFYTDNALMSFYSRLNYTFLDNYLLTASLRADGSSRFSPDNRWGLFPSLALAWRMTDLSFVRAIPSVSNLKLRAGWGITGQQDGIGDYAWIANYSYSDSASQYQFGNNFLPMLRPQGFDANLKWEESKSINVGIDFGLFKNRLNGTIDFYKKWTYDLLSVIPTQAGTNFTDNILTNVGNLENQGVEFNINWIALDQIGRNLEFGFNATWNQTKITKLSKVPDGSQGILVGGISGPALAQTIQIHSVGFAPFTFYTYRQLYDSTGRPVEGKYLYSLPGSGKDTIIDARNLSELQLNKNKNPMPTVFLGFYGNYSFKKWGAGFSMRGEIGRYVYNNVNSGGGVAEANGRSQNVISNLTSDYLNTNFTTYQVKSDYYLERADFLRLDNLYLSYNFGKIPKTDLTCRVSASVQNAFVLTNYSGIDPEIFSGIDNNIYPRARVFNLNLNLRF